MSAIAIVWKTERFLSTFAKPVVNLSKGIMDVPVVDPFRHHILLLHEAVLLRNPHPMYPLDQIVRVDEPCFAFGKAFGVHKGIFT
jgi:hypothetical protein